MKLTPVLIMTAGALLTASCGGTLSIVPFYEDRDKAFDLPLEGLWTDQDAKETWNVRKTAGGYEVGERQEALRLQVVRLEGQHWLDISCCDSCCDDSSPSIPGHLIARVWIEGDELCVQTMDTDWLKGKVRELGFPHLELPDRKQIILTAPAPMLRKFVLLYANEPRAFSETSRFHRVR
ncbi:MAG: hypothetical protein IT161_21930 [Bryobacterales bacterium]|nr:hypothetical protein [Bryobacterales bacterium]